MGQSMKQKITEVGMLEKQREKNQLYLVNE